MERANGRFIGAWCGWAALLVAGTSTAQMPPTPEQARAAPDRTIGAKSVYGRGRECAQGYAPARRHLRTRRDTKALVRTGAPILGYVSTIQASGKPLER